ncbi:MAG: hypothetical protein AB7V16_11245 [Vulcanibacillus sp.]
MCDFYVYKNIKKQIEEEQVLNDHLGISTNTIREINADNDVELIEQIYKHCYKEAFYFSWSYQIENLKLKTEIADNYKNDYEKHIFDHCVIAALYTVQHMLYNNKHVSIPDLANKVRCNGHNSIINEKLLESNDLKYIEQSNQRVIENTIKSSFNSDGGKDNYLLRTLDIRIKCNYINPELGKYEVSFPLFLSNFSYMVMTKLKKFNSYELIERVLNSKDYRDSNINISKFLSKYYNCAISSSLNHVKSMLNQDTTYKLTEIDEMLLYYKKERLLNSDLIKYYINKDNGEYLLNADKSILNLCSMLPNVFSRNIFVEYFGHARYEDNNDYANRIHEFSCESLEFLIMGTFPIFEKTFFITLYNYYVKRLNKSLEDLNTLLLNYVNKIYSRILINDIPANFKEYFNEKSYEEKSRKKSKVYDILEYSILNTLQINSNNISEFKYSGKDNLKFNMVEEFMYFMKLRSKYEEVTPDSILNQIKIINRSRESFSNNINI